MNISRLQFVMLIAALLALISVIATAKGDSSAMQKQSRIVREEVFAWGPECANGLSVGLSVSRRVFHRESPFQWRWAIRNTTNEPRSVTVYSDIDMSWRYRLQVFKAGADQPIAEFPPHFREPVTTANFSETVVVVKDVPKKLEPEETTIGPSLTAGVYRLQVRFGGPGFNFDCRSGVVEIEMK